MEYILALLTLTFGFLLGKIYGAASVTSLERSLIRAVYKGEEVIIAVGDKAVRTRVKDGKVITEKIIAEVEVKEESKNDV